MRKLIFRKPSSDSLCITKTYDDFIFYSYTPSTIFRSFDHIAVGWYPAVGHTRSTLNCGPRQRWISAVLDLLRQHDAVRECDVQLTNHLLQIHPMPRCRAFE